MINLNQIEWRKIRKPVGIAALGLFIFYVLINNVIMPVYTRHGQSIKVPDLTNLLYEDAREVLNRLDLKIVEETKKYDTSDQFPIGTIMVQNPRSGTEVKSGRRVYVIVSKGEPMVEMPKLLGESQRNAIFILENLGLKLGEIYYTFSDSSDQLHIGKVIQQSVPVGSEIKIGTLVNITVISESGYFFAPQVIGRSLTDARRIIFQAGLALGDIYYEEKSDLLPETVIDQYPGSEQKVSRGDTLSLWISQLPDSN